MLRGDAATTTLGWSRVDGQTSAEVVIRDLLGRCRQVNRLPVPGATRESKTTMLTAGRRAMFRECVTSGDEIL